MENIMTKDPKVPVFFYGQELSNQFLLGIEFQPKTIHLFCASGKEEDLYNSLPLFIQDYGEIVIGTSQIIIRLKQC